MANYQHCNIQVTFIKKVAAENILLGIGDLTVFNGQKSSSARKGSGHNKNEKTAQLKEMICQTINQVKLSSNENHEAIVESWKQIESKVEKTLYNVLQESQMVVKNEIYDKIKELTNSLNKAGKTDLACASIHCEFKLIQTFYEGRTRLKKLVIIGISMQDIVKKMVKLQDGDRFLEKERLFMDNVLEDMQMISNEVVGINIKFMLVAGFCIAFGVCCIETNNANLAKDIFGKAIFLIECLHIDSTTFNKLLRCCYQNLSVSFQRLHQQDSTDAVNAKVKCKRLANIPEKPEELMSVETLVLSIVPF